MRLFARSERFFSACTSNAICIVLSPESSQQTCLMAHVLGLVAILGSRDARTSYTDFMSWLKA